jgi:predicted nucleotidyltransferase
MPHAYPTTAHQRAAEAIVEYFESRGYVDAVLLTNSCARGKATADSCLDMAVLVQSSASVTEIDRVWEQHYRTEPVFDELRTVGRFSEVHLDVITGEFKPSERNSTGGPDDYEVQIGNYLAYSVPLTQRTDRFVQLRDQYIPFYDDTQRSARLAMARMYVENDLDHISVYIPRGLYFQSFNRLYDAYRGFLQTLFVARRTYPIAYDKWIQEQIIEILGLPHLYAELPRLFEISKFESDEILTKASRLRELLDTYAVDG